MLQVYIMNILKVSLISASIIAGVNTVQAASLHGAQDSSPAIADEVSIIATPRSESATSLGGETFFSQTFDVTLTNVGEKEIDLTTLCLAARDSSGKEFHLDTIQNTLTSGTLKPGTNIKGFAGFAGPDESVYKARAVVISGNCAQ